jgi:hypothetical protein
VVYSSSMTELSTLIDSQIQRFHITLSNGLNFWAPYLRNDNHAEVGSLVPRGLGKSSSDEIRQSAEYVIGLFPDINSEELRRKLIDGSLPELSMNYKGIDCSGFVFYVMDQLYKDLFSRPLASDLYVPKANVLNGAFNFLEWQNAYKLSEEEASSLAEYVPMEWVVNTFHRKAVNLCNVASIASDYSSDLIDINQCRPSDLLHIKIKDDPIPHIAIITDVDERTITVAHSSRKDISNIGGVLIETITHTNGRIDPMTFTGPGEFSVRRLKSLAKHTK